MSYSLLRCLLVGAIGVIAFSGTPKAAHKCGQKKGGLAGRQKDGVYALEYQSWVEKQGDRQFEFGRSVKNDHATSLLFVDWKKTGVKGYARPKDCVFAIFPSLSDAKKTTKTDLWYGAKPRSIRTDFLADVRADPKKVAKSRRLQYQDLKPLQSRIRVGIPISIKDPRADALTVVDVGFQSDVVKLDTPDDLGEAGPFLCRILWSDNSSDRKRPNFRIRFSLPEKLLPAKTKMVGRLKPPRTLLLHSPQWEPSREWRRETRALVFLSNGHPVRKKVLVRFLDIDGKEAATGQIVVYVPSAVD